jgi:hypothetical protein
MTELNTSHSFDSLLSHFHKKGRGAIVITHQNVEEYPGMVLYLGLHFDIDQQEYDLDIEWISFGLDAFGENLLEGYLYRFDSLEKLLAYLQEKYNIAVTDIPLNYCIDQSKFPNPFTNADQKSEFEAAWKKFQADFATKMFLDRSQRLIHSTHDENLSD